MKKMFLTVALICSFVPFGGGNTPNPWSAPLAQDNTTITYNNENKAEFANSVEIQLRGPGEQDLVTID